MLEIEDVPYVELRGEQSDRTLEELLFILLDNAGYGRDENFIRRVTHFLAERVFIQKMYNNGRMPAPSWLRPLFSALSMNDSKSSKSLTMDEVFEVFVAIHANITETMMTVMLKERGGTVTGQQQHQDGILKRVEFDGGGGGDTRKRLQVPEALQRIGANAFMIALRAVARSENVIKFLTLLDTDMMRANENRTIEKMLKQVINIVDEFLFNGMIVDGIKDGTQKIVETIIREHLEPNPVSFPPQELCWPQIVSNGSVLILVIYYKVNAIVKSILFEQSLFPIVEAEHDTVAAAAAARNTCRPRSRSRTIEKSVLNDIVFDPNLLSNVGLQRWRTSDKIDRRAVKLLLIGIHTTIHLLECLDYVKRTDRLHNSAFISIWMHLVPSIFRRSEYRV